MSPRSLAAVALAGLGVVVAGLAALPEPAAQPAPESASQPGVSFSAFVSPAGEISFPHDARDRWTHIGSWALTGKEGRALETVHDVYAQPEAVSHFRQTGAWMDGAVLVKEVRTAQSGALTSGHATWAGETELWFVMVKDTEGRFEGNPNWGNGWGWALFNADAPSVNTSTNWRIDCFGCHAPARANDWVFLDGYPSLRPPGEEATEP